MSASNPQATPRFGPDGLVPVIVQDEADRRVLMLAHMDAEALAATLGSGEVHFHSRSRNRLWKKGETSGNVLHLVRIDLDCDRDAVLATVRPHGPTCHRGTRSCFDSVGDEASSGDPASPGAGSSPAVRTDANVQPQGFAWLETLWATIEDRSRTRPAGSYTTSLLEGGVDATGRKVTEEATELLMAAKDDASAEAAGGDRDVSIAAFNGEAADLIYHALVLMAERGQTPSSAIKILAARHAR